MFSNNDNDHIYEKLFDSMNKYWSTLDKTANLNGAINLIKQNYFWDKSSWNLMNQYLFKQDDGTFLLMALAYLIGHEKLIQFLEENRDPIALAKAALDSCVDRPAQCELAHLAFDYIADNQIDLYQKAELLKSLRPEHYDAAALIAYLNAFKSDDTNPNESVNQLAFEILMTVHGKTVLDICSGQGNFLESAYKKDHNLELFGQERDAFNYFVSKFRLMLIGTDKSRIEQGNVLSDPKLIEHGQLMEFDMVFTNFPFLELFDPNNLSEIDRYWNKIPLTLSPRNTADWQFVCLAVNMMKSTGKAVAVMCNGPLLKITDESIRRQLIEMGLVEAVIQLPERLFAYTKIPTSLLVLSHGNQSIRFIDASAIYTAGRRFNDLSQENISEILEMYKSGTDSARCKSVSFDEIAANGYNLDPSRYLTFNTIQVAAPVRLGAVAEEIFRGIQLPAQEIDRLSVPNQEIKEPYRLLNVSDIENGQIGNATSFIYPPPSMRLDRYCLKDGDIVITSKGTKIKTAVAEVKFKERILASGNLLIVRPNISKVNPYYLKAFLDSSTGQRLLQSIQTGSVVISINPSQLENMDISLLDMGKQDTIAIHYLAKQDQIRLMRKKLAALEAELTNLYDTEAKNI